VEILNVIDDHSRLLVASRAFVTANAAEVVETFHLGATELGLPALMLSDNWLAHPTTTREPAPPGASAAHPGTSLRARTKAKPRRPGIAVPAEQRVRRDRIDKAGKVTLR
jgi:hypothetical protein